MLKILTILNTLSIIEKEIYKNSYGNFTKYNLLDIKTILGKKLDVHYWKKTFAKNI